MILSFNIFNFNADFITYDKFVTVILSDFHLNTMEDYGNVGYYDNCVIVIGYLAKVSMHQ